MNRPAYHEGGKEVILGNMNITMSHDELVKELGDAYKKITDAGFVMMPKKWREDVMNFLSNQGKT